MFFFVCLFVFTHLLFILSYICFESSFPLMFYYCFYLFIYSLICRVWLFFPLSLFLFVSFLRTLSICHINCSGITVIIHITLLLGSPNSTLNTRNEWGLKFSTSLRSLIRGSGTILSNSGQCGCVSSISHVNVVQQWTRVSGTIHFNKWQLSVKLWAINELILMNRMMWIL